MPLSCLFLVTGQSAPKLTCPQHAPSPSAYERPQLLLIILTSHYKTIHGSAILPTILSWSRKALRVRETPILREPRPRPPRTTKAYDTFV
jgi:hypothetical protein